MREGILTACDESMEIGGVHFFGGAMWTDFTGGNPLAMLAAEQQMNNYRCIRMEAKKPLKPQDTIDMHHAFMEKLQYGRLRQRALDGITQAGWFQPIVKSH